MLYTVNGVGRTETELAAMLDVRHLPPELLSILNENDRILNGKVFWQAQINLNTSSTYLKLKFPRTGVRRKS
jgi:hypothetical protein